MMSAGWGVCWPLAGWLCCAVLCCAGGDRAPGLRCDAGGLGCADAGAGTGAPPPPRSVTRHLRRRQSKPTRHRPRPPPGRPPPPPPPRARAMPVFLPALPSPDRRRLWLAPPRQAAAEAEEVCSSLLYEYLLLSRTCLCSGAASWRPSARRAQ
jgi:hypothetical protein